MDHCLRETQKVFFCKEHLLILPLAGQLVKFCAGSYPRRTTQHLVLSVSTLKLQTIILLLLYLNFPVTLHHNISVVYSSTVLQYLLLFDGLPWKNCNLCYIICYTQFTHSRAISFGNINNPHCQWYLLATLNVAPARWPQLWSVKEMAKWRSTWTNTQRRERRKCDIKYHWLYQQLSAPTTVIYTSWKHNIQDFVVHYTSTLPVYFLTYYGARALLLYCPKWSRNSDKQTALRTSSIWRTKSPLLP